VEKVLILGGRRGLGAAVAEKWASTHSQSELVVSSRREFTSSHRTLQADFTRAADVEKLEAFIREWRPQRVFCFAGGGPHGGFAEKCWKDHEWALTVSLVTPMRLLHSYLQAVPEGQWIMTGSAIAEAQPDARAASYAASKHALKGLISTLRAENPRQDVRLFSPGYMDTELLPANSAPRLENRVLAPTAVAVEFVLWAADPAASWHRVCPS